MRFEKQQHIQFTKNMKRLIIFVLSLAVLALTYRQISQSYQVDTTAHKEAMSFIYQHLVQNFLPLHKLDWKKLDDICSQIDINSYLHPDTILEDKYLFNFELEYKDKIALYPKLGFIYKRLSGQLKNDTQGRSVKYQGIQSSTWSYPGWFSTHTCAFEKKMRMPLLVQIGKSKYNFLQNEILAKLKSNGANEECLSQAKMFNQGFSLDNPQECTQAMEILRNDEYINPDGSMKYLQKSDSDQGTGIWPLLEKEATGLLKRYQNGTLCGNNTFKPFQIQEFVANPLLLNIPDTQGVPRGHMFVFRIFFIAVSAQPTIIYMYDSTSVFICVHPYNKEKFTHYTHFCHNKFANQFKDEQGMYGEEALNYSKARDLGITFQEFTDRFAAQGAIPKGTTAEEFIYQKFEKKAGYYFRNIWKSHQDSRFGQWSAFDVIMNDKLEMFLLEMNIGYTLEEKYEERAIFLRTLQYNNNNLVMRFVREKYKRLKEFLDLELLPAVRNKQLQQKAAALKTKLVRALTDVPLKEKFVDHYRFVDFDKGMAICKPYL